MRSTVRTTRKAKPAWLKFPVISPLTRNPYHITVPQSWLQYDEAEDKAYCRLLGIPWYKRVKPEVPESRTGKHPRSAFRNLPSEASRVRIVKGQTEAFTEGAA